MSDPAAYDAIIIGGGPAGATAALQLARKGLRCVVLEKTRFPRFHIGESLLPRNFPLIQELGLEQAIRGVPSTPKLGVEFTMGYEPVGTTFSFANGLLPGSPTMNIERASFDMVLLSEARAAGAEVREETAVREILKLADGDVSVRLNDGSELRGKYLLDASGQATVVARHLGTRKTYESRHLQKVAYFAHFENITRRPGKQEGMPTIVMADEAWFWIIPIDERRTSIGMVMDAAVSKTIEWPSNQMLAWGIRRCPAVLTRAADAVGPGRNEVIANFSYNCRPFAGPGYFLVGDSAAFLDPIFSSGICLGMMAGCEAADQVTAVVREGRSPRAARRAYCRLVRHSTSVFFNLIRQYYHHSFRELFLNGAGPLQVHRAVLSVLAGQVFPCPPFCLRWRLRLFDIFVPLNKWFRLVPRRARFSLLAQESAEWMPERNAVVVGA